MAITRLSLDGYGAKRGGPFSGKAGQSHPVDTITRLSLDGYGAKRAGSFAGKTADGGSTHPVGIITRLSLDGYGARIVGDFTGKAAYIPPVFVEDDDDARPDGKGKGPQSPKPSPKTETYVAQADYVLRPSKFLGKAQQEVIGDAFKAAIVTATDKIVSDQAARIEKDTALAAEFSRRIEAKEAEKQRAIQVRADAEAARKLSEQQRLLAAERQYEEEWLDFEALILLDF